MKKRTLLTLALICALIVSLAVPLCASLWYNNVAETYEEAYILGDKLYVDYGFEGSQGLTERVTISVTVEKKTLLLFWSEVDSWSTVTTNYYGNFSRNLTLSQTGNYRVTIAYTIEGSGGSADEITKTINLTY